MGMFEVRHGRTPPTPALARGALIAATAVRLAYGLGALLHPAGMVAAKLAPETHDEADPRLLLRAFGGHQILIAGFAAESLKARRGLGSALALSFLVDLLDVTSAAIEVRTRGGPDRTLVGGMALSGAGVATGAAGLLAVLDARRRSCGVDGRTGG